MLKQTVPHIKLDQFNIKKLKELIDNNEVFINPEYQRSDTVWSKKQKTDLITSIYNCYSIGVFVVFINNKSQYEVLDGQQRIRTIERYLNDDLELDNTELPYYGELSQSAQTSFDDYNLYSLRLTGDISADDEENITQTFLRLQQGTPLNKAEILNAQRGKFKDAFRNIRDSNPIFSFLKNDKRFRFRQLAAELLMLELETDYETISFPNLDKKSMLDIVDKYKASLSNNKVKQCEKNLEFLSNSLNYLLTGFNPGEVISFYMLLSYLWKKKADKSGLIDEFSEFAREFLKNLNSFSMYDSEPPDGMDKPIFDEYMKYKQETKVMTSSSSLKKRFEVLYKEYNRLHPVIIADPKRLHDAEQKRTLFFQQKGKCRFCGKPMDFKKSSAHHVIAHKLGGKTDDLKHSALLHERCHQKLEKQLSKGIEIELIELEEL